MKPQIIPSRLLRPLGLLAIGLVANLATADTIKFKDGKPPLEGKILSEDATSVTIRYMLKPTIPDTKTIPRADILSIEKKTPEDLEAEAVKKLLPTDDFLLPSAYTKLINEGPAKFLAAHPTSKYKTEIEAVKKTLEEEMAQARRGMRKVDGKWLTGEEIQANEYNINAMRSLRKMQKLAAESKYREALLEFISLEATGKLSISYPKGVELAKDVLAKYGAKLAQDIKSLPQKNKEAEEKLGKMVPEEVRQAKAEREKQKREFMALIIEEKKQKVKFNSTNDMDLASLTEASKQVDLETKRLAVLNVTAIAETAAKYDKILKLIGQKKFSEASAQLDEFVKNTKLAVSDPQIKRQQEELKKLRDESIRSSRQRELLNRTQPKPVDSKPLETGRPTGTPQIK
jgi:hypothetical protein